MFNHPGLIIGSLCVLVVLQLASMVWMSVRMKVSKLPVSVAQWETFRKLTWSTVATSVVLIVVSIIIATRYQNHF